MSKKIVSTIGAFSTIFAPFAASAEEGESPSVSLFVDIDEPNIKVENKTFHKTCPG